MMQDTINYAKLYQFEVQLAGERITYFSKPGLANWDQISTSTCLLADHLQHIQANRILTIGTERGVVEYSLSRKYAHCEIVLCNTNYLEIEMARQSLDGILDENVTLCSDIILPTTTKGSFDAVAVRLPKGRKFARKLILLAHQVLRDGGELYITGEKNLGIKSALNDGESLFGNIKLLGYKKGTRLARFRKSSSSNIQLDWVQLPGIQPDTWSKFCFNWLGETLSISSLPGIFSYDHIDDGTRLLIDSIEIIPGMNVLDLGCGNGILGLVAARSGSSQITLVDSNLLAISAARKNLNHYGYKDAKVVPSDILSEVADVEYDLILSNPPFHTARETNYLIVKEIIWQSWQKLKPGGRLILVANRFLPYQKEMEKKFTRVYSAAETNRYHVIVGEK